MLMASERYSVQFGWLVYPLRGFGSKHGDAAGSSGLGRLITAGTIPAAPGGRRTASGNAPTPSGSYAVWMSCTMVKRGEKPCAVLAPMAFGPTLGVFLNILVEMA